MLSIHWAEHVMFIWQNEKKKYKSKTFHTKRFPIIFLKQNESDLFRVAFNSKPTF